MRAVWVPAAALVALIVVVFAPVRGHDFVAYDDHWFVVDNPHVARGLTAEGLRWAFAPENAYVGTGGPLTWLSHMLDVELFGMTPGPQHVINVLLHGVNAALLLAVLWRLTGAVGRSACVAALFAIHPLHVESVAWIAERKDVLSTTFWLLTTAAYVRYARHPGIGRYALVLLGLTLGLLAKPVVATLPFTLLLLDAWPLGRAKLSWSDRRRWGSLLLEKLPLLVPAAVVMLMTVNAQQEIGAVSTTATLSWSFRLQNAAVSYVAYLWKTIWPVHLAVFYPYPDRHSIVTVCLSVLAIAALSVAAWRAARTRPYVTVGWLWYVGTLIPMIGLVQVGSHSMADRFTYVPLIGVFIAVTWGVAELVGRSRIWRVAGVAFACSAIATFGVIARAQVHTWRDSETLWRHALAVTDGNFRAYAGLAEVLARRGNVEAAIGQYREAVRLAPDAAEWQVNLGLLHVGQGQVVEAAMAFRRALAVRPNDAETHNNLGAMLARQGQTADAIAHYRRSLDLKPAYALARRNLGLALASQGNVEAGLAEGLEALRRQPDEGQWHYEVAVMLLMLGKSGDAIAHLREAVRLLPRHPDAHRMLTDLTRSSR